MAGLTLITAKTETGTESREVLFPDTCPTCFHAMDARFITAYMYEDAFEENLEIVFQCPRTVCHHLFIAFYAQYGSDFELTDIRPKNFKATEFSTHIVAISKDFASIYNEAKISEELKLNQIMGAGYRKALEFLIKDYAIIRNPDKAEEIKSMLLGKVIDKYVTDTRIKSTAKRAAWLGNDETHYYRKWGDKDITDLRTLLELTVRWIESEELTRQYEENMKD